MQHDILIEGFLWRLRPVTNLDAPFIYSLRSDPFLNRYLHETIGGVTGQLAWLDTYYRRPGDYYFIVENLESNTAEGLISIYDLQKNPASGEWGRWIIKKGSFAALESAWMIYRCAFEVLNLDEIFCRTHAENHTVISFHDSCGIRRRRLLASHINLDGKKVDAIEHRVRRSESLEILKRLANLASVIARRFGSRGG